jgi:hypothetical protein
LRLLFDDEVGTIAVFILAGLVCVGLLFVAFPWALILRLICPLWFWIATAMTAVILIIMVVLCVVAEEMFSGDGRIPLFLNRTPYKRYRARNVDRGGPSARYFGKTCVTIGNGDN